MNKILDVTTLRSRPLTPNSGGTGVQSPPELGDLGSVPEFVQEVYSKKPRNSMVPELGLVCITVSKAVRYRTVTRKRLFQFDQLEQARMLRELYADNLQRLGAAIEFCSANQIRLYRLSSGLFPFADDVIGEKVLEELEAEIGLVGDRASRLNIRLVLHPDQFVVLSSDRPEVIENSIKILKTHARIFDFLKLPQSPWALMNIHGGKGNRAERLIRVIQELPNNVRSRLTFENDEYTYSSQDIFAVCQAANVPMLFDAHHHVIHEHLDTYEDPSVAEMLEAARSTWEIPEWQMVHISNGAEAFGDQRHSDYITIMPSSYRQAPWIEVEAKQKELAIKKLQDEWLFSNVNELAPVISEPTQLTPEKEGEKITLLL